MELRAEFWAGTVHVADPSAWKVFKVMGVNEVTWERVWREKGRDPC